MDKILARNNPFFKNLDLILGKQNQASIQLALLKHEQKQLSSENDDLKVIMREVFHNLATSSDLGMRSVADRIIASLLCLFLDDRPSNRVQKFLLFVYHLSF